MRRIVVSCLLIGVVLLKGTSAFGYPVYSAYNRILNVVEARDEQMLRKMVSNGINVNAQSPSGETALCTMIRRGDSKGYRMLFNQGATVHTPCVRQIPPQTLHSFYLANPDLGRYVDGRILVPDVVREPASDSDSSLVSGIPWPHLGEFALIGAAVGIAALIRGGGGGDPGGSSSNKAYLYKPVETDLTLEDFPTLGGYWNSTALKKVFVDTEDEHAYENFNKYADDYFNKLDKNNPEWYAAQNKKYAWEYNGGPEWNYYTREIKETTEGNVTTTTIKDTFYPKNPVAYLPMVNAASAWVRGYTGYIVDRTNPDNPQITNKKVKVAVLDTGLEVGEYAHDQLKNNISTTRLNYSYGPCSTNNKTKCWAYDTMNGKAYLVSNSTSALIDSVPADYEAEYNMGSRAKWNEYAGQFAPECSSSVTTNCLVFELDPLSSKHSVTYYPDGVSSTSGTTDGVITYSISSNSWHEYEAKYADTGYVYDKNDPTPGLLSDNSMWNTEGHGTHISGVLGAVRDGEGISGVAPDVEIIPVRADFQMNQVMNHLKEVVEETDARVVNLSLGSTATQISSSAATNKGLWDMIPDDAKAGYQAALDKEHDKQKGTVLVFAAGNEGKMQPSVYTVAPLVGDSDDLKENYDKSPYKNLLISVISVDENKKISDFGTVGGVKSESNRCGSSSMYCLAAPGGSSTYPVGSTDMGKSYALAMGTSQATPIVTGSVALLMGAFPFLKPQEVVQILFKTADYITPTPDEITAYNSAAKTAGDGDNAYEKNTVDGEYNAIYGHGLVNLDKATDPIGVPKISFDTTAASALAVNASSTTVTVPANFANTLSVLPKNIVVLDEYTRPYAMPTTRFVNTEKRTDTLKRSFQSFMASDEKVVETNDHLSFGFTEAPSDSVGLPTGSMTMQMKPTKDMSLRMAYTQDTKSFGGTYADRIVQNPFMNMRQAWGTDMAYRVAGHWSLTGGFKYGQDAFIDSETLDKMSEKPMISVVQTGMRYAPKKSVVFDMSFGQMNEEESLFGLRGAGAFETDGNKTKFVSFGTSVMPFDKWQLSASYTYGVTDANATQTLMKFSRLTSDAFALAALYRPDEKSTYGFKVASPLRVRSGTVTFDLPTARDMYADRLYRTQYTSDMKPDAREYDLSLFFMNQLKEQLSIAGEAGVRLHPDHQKEAKPDYQTLFKLEYQY